MIGTVTADLRQRGLTLYSVALAGSAAFQVLHLFLLPLVVSPDGLEYVSLSRELASADVLERWPFVRMPLYPLLLRGTFAVFGENAIAAMIPGTVLGFAGIWVLGSELRRTAGPLVGAAVIALLSLYPVLIAYQHTILTESGTFCFIAAVVAIFLRLARDGSSLGTIALLGVVLAAAFLYRSTLLGVVPAAATLVVAMTWAERRRSSGSVRSHLAARAVVGALVVGCLPLAVWRVWVSEGRSVPVHRAFAYNMLLYLAAQRVIPADEPLLASVKPTYEAALAGAGPLSLVHVPDDVLGVLHLHAPNGRAIFLRVITSNLGAYLIGAARTTVVFGGIRTPTSDNHLFTSNVLSLSFPGSKCVCPTDARGRFDPAFSRPGRRTPLHYILKILYPLYGPLVVAGWLFTIVGLLVGLWRFDLRLLAVTAVPVAFAVGHIALVFGLDRFAAPTFPLALANLVVVSHRIAYRPTEVVPGAQCPGA